MMSIPEKSAFPLAKATRGEETVTLRGTSRGFELIVADGVDLDAMLGSIVGQLDKSPGFFAGNDVIIQFAGHPIPGALGPLEEIANEYDLTIVAIRSELEDRRGTAKAALAVVSDLLDPVEEETDSIEVDLSDQPDEAVGADSLSGDSVDDIDDLVDSVQAAADSFAGTEKEAEDVATSGVVESVVDAATTQSTQNTNSPPLAFVASEPEPMESSQTELVDTPSSENRVSLEAMDAVRALALQAPDAAKIVIGPVRSGCILEATEHVVIVGDVNPGAEVTSIGAIIVLGRMRGIAHAGAGGNPAFIFALQLEPQQLRLGTKVARAGDGDSAGTRPEIARIEKDQIIVEPYAGRLPFSLARMLS